MDQVFKNPSCFGPIFVLRDTIEMIQILESEANYRKYEKKTATQMYCSLPILEIYIAICAHLFTLL